MTTTTEASAKASSAYTVVTVRDDAHVTAQRHASGPEQFSIGFSMADYSQPLTVYLSPAQALALYHRLGDALIDAAAVAE
jgi:hypothetical protein